MTGGVHGGDLPRAAEGSPDGAIVAESLSKKFGSRVAVDSVNFSVRRGEIGRASCRERVFGYV